MLNATATFRYVFDYREKDIYWCTADVGWITGHTYVVYAPLLNAATSVMVSFKQLIRSEIIVSLSVNYADLIDKEYLYKC